MVRSRPLPLSLMMSIAALAAVPAPAHAESRGVALSLHFAAAPVSLVRGRYADPAAVRACRALNARFEGRLDRRRRHVQRGSDCRRASQRPLVISGSVPMLVVRP